MTLPIPAAARGVVGLAGRLGGLTGWRQAAVAAVLGIAATAALPPVHLVPLVFVAFTGLVWLLEAADEKGEPGGLRRAFLVGWWFGFGHFVTNLYWLAHALLIDAAQFGWMVPFAVFGLSGVLALFSGAATAATVATRARGVARLLILAVAWTAGEWLRGHILTGFPWNLIGTVWAGSLPVMQVVSLVGLYGLGLLTVLVAALPATVTFPVRGWTGPLAAALLLALAWAFGMSRIPDGVASDAAYRLRLVQPNVPQSLKWDPAQREANLAKTLALSRSAGFEGRTHVIWPETAVPFVVTDFNDVGPALRGGLATAVPPGGLLLTGAPRAERDAERRLLLWNSLHAIDGAGAIVATYDKFHLVPFGEYVPLRSILRIAKVTVGTVDFSPGPGLETLSLPGLPPASPLVCYEAIFPGRVVAPGPRPAWLLNVTNDAWFGLSSGPYQHFVAARFRAVEEGLPLVRAANNGISAVIDPYGRIGAQLGLGETGVVDADLPRSLSPTLYARVGDLTVVGLALVLVALAGWSCRTRTRER